MEYGSQLKLALMDASLNSCSRGVAASASINTAREEYEMLDWPPVRNSVDTRLYPGWLLRQVHGGESFWMTRGLVDNPWDSKEAAYGQRLLWRRKGGGRHAYSPFRRCIAHLGSVAPASLISFRRGLEEDTQVGTSHPTKYTSSGS